MIHAEQPDLKEPKGDLNALLAQRRQIEAEMDTYSAILDRNGIGMNDALVTRDGFPRSDIDVANVRIARTSIIRLKNDFKRLNDLIEVAVHEAFKNGTPVNIVRENRPFCWIDSVAPGSPASTAGLQKDDKVITFGRAHYNNHEKLQRMASEVQISISSGRPIKITISRVQNGATLELEKELMPNTNWGGRGAMGFHCLPL